MAEKGGKQIFYKIDDAFSFEELIICEGEIDALSFEEASFRNAVSVPDILRKAIQEHGRFPCTCLAHDVCVPTTVGSLDSKPASDISIVGLAKYGDFLRFHGRIIPEEVIVRQGGKVASFGN